MQLIALFTFSPLHFAISRCELESHGVCKRLLCKLLMKVCLESSLIMEVAVRKYQQKFKQVREQMGHWDTLQGQLLSQFKNMSSIFERLEMIQDGKNYLSLRRVDGIEAAVLREQLDTLEMILLSINKTMEEFRAVDMWLGKMVKDGRQIVRAQPRAKQQHKVGVKPSLTDCLDGLILVHEMHHSEYLLKMSIVAALPRVTTESRAHDLSSLEKLLVDQPCISREKGDFARFTVILQ